MIFGREEVGGFLVNVFDVSLAGEDVLSTLAGRRFAEPSLEQAAAPHRNIKATRKRMDCPVRLTAREATPASKFEKLTW